MLDAGSGNITAFPDVAAFLEVRLAVFVVL